MLTSLHSSHSLLLSGQRRVVELGCGRKKVEVSDDKSTLSVVGVDKVPFPGVDIVADLEASSAGSLWWWAEDDSCRLVISHQTLEHIRELIPVMNQIWRICDADSYVETVVPYGAGPGALQDPTHVRFFTEITWRYWEPGFVDAFGDYGIRGYFAVCGVDWRPGGNLWALLRPLKGEEDVNVWKVLRDAEGWPRLDAPKWLTDRRHKLLGDRG